MGLVVGAVEDYVLMEVNVRIIAEAAEKLVIEKRDNQATNRKRLGRSETDSTQRSRSYRWSGGRYPSSW